MKPLENYQRSDVDFLLARGTSVEDLRAAPFIIRKERADTISPGSLIPIGGAATDNELTVVANAVRENTSLVIVTTPTAEEGKSFDSYEARFRDLGVQGKITQISRETARDEGAKLLESASETFTVGGNQLVAIQSLENTGLLEVFRYAQAQGVIHAGTSAGASYMGERMPMSISNDDESHHRSTQREVVRFVQGSGLTHRVVDQHVQQRGRKHRVIAAMEVTGRKALGLDEATGIIIPPGEQTMQTFGEGNTHLTYVLDNKVNLESVPPGVIIDFALTRKVKEFPRS